MSVTDKIDKYLTEEQLTKGDRQTISSTVLQGKSKNINLKGFDNEKVEVKSEKNGTAFIFDKSIEDLAASLVDIADALGYEVDMKDKGNKTHFIFLDK